MKRFNLIFPVFLMILPLIVLQGCSGSASTIWIDGDSQLPAENEADTDGEGADLEGIDAADGDAAENETLTCPQGYSACARECVDLWENKSHCGTCEIACRIDQICFQGLCHCPHGQTECNGRCLDTLNDPDNCGGCGVENEPQQDVFICGSTRNKCPKLVCDDGTCVKQTCPDPLKLCCAENLLGGTCINVANDPQNCGDCGIVCAAPKSCQNGNCLCPANLAECPSLDGSGNTICADVATHMDHCGGCTTAGADHRCRYLDEICRNGQCACKDATPDACPKDAERSQFCTNFLTDIQNCGECGHACPLDGLNRQTVCQQGLCTSSDCGQSGQASCGGSCVDLYSDSSNCGSCGTACGSDQRCQNGRCVCSADPQMTQLLVCGSGAASFCVDPAIDNANCGSCNRSCLGDQHCEMRQCVCNGRHLSDGDVEDESEGGEERETSVYDNAGFIICGGICYDGANDTTNCGACGHYCPGGQHCEEGHCLCNDSTLTSCGNWPNLFCTNAQTDFYNCRICDNECDQNAICKDGVCMCDAQGQYPDKCGKICTNLSHDVANCGQCGVPCTASLPYCVNGECTIICGDVSFPDTCRVSDQAYCTNLQTSNSDCGSCGHVCQPGTHCGKNAQGEAECQCDIFGQTYCPGAGCVDLTLDNGHCGRCANKCGTNRHCGTNAQGSSTCVCDLPYEECGGQCVDKQTSLQHCGECGHYCTAGQSCIYGQCTCEVSRPDKCGTYPNEKCVDFMSDEANCGGCGSTDESHLCKSDQTCLYGTCQCTQKGYTNCWAWPNGQCVDTNLAKQHCGFCGHACPGLQSCIGGTCSCPNDTPDMCGVWPNSSCVSFQRDNNNCGRCGRVCTANNMHCQSGDCVCNAVNDRDCPNDGEERCYSVLTDSAHCGPTCVSCPATQICTEGRCECPSNSHLCGDTCYSDYGAHCPTGGNACVDCSSLHRSCNGNGGVGCGGCLAGYHECGGTCYPDSGNNPCGGNNCSSCGNNATCSNNICICSSSKYKNCDSTWSNGCETNVTTDPNHCGDCGAPACVGGQICESSHCTCPSGKCLSGSTCYDFSHEHCGSGCSACSSSQICKDQVCASCGSTGAVCCQNDTCNSGNICQSGTCKACGGANQPCCGGSSCGASSLTCSSGTCVACGGVNQPCCGGSSCGASTLACSSGVCVSCGGYNQPCCGSSCSVGTCTSGKCQCPSGQTWCSSVSQCKTFTDSCCGCSCNTCDTNYQKCVSGSCTAQCTHDQGELMEGCSTNDSSGCAKNMYAFSTDCDSWQTMSTNARVFPANDWDYYGWSVTGEGSSYGIPCDIDPTIEVSNKTNIALTVCLWWRTGAATPALTCPSGTTLNIHQSGQTDWWNNSYGCCKTSSSSTISITLNPTEELGYAKARITSSSQSCGSYTFRYRM